MTEQNFKISKEDACLYIRERDGNKMFLVLYIDDGLVVASDKEELNSFLHDLKQSFKIVERPATCYLGLEIDRRRDGKIKIPQEAYAKRILERFNFSNCNPVSTPMVKGSMESGKEDDETGKKFPYRQAVGAVMYLMIGSRPGLAYNVGVLSRSLESPSNEDIGRLKRVLRYIKGTVSLGITVIL
jgi:hypothetical protein